MVDAKRFQAQELVVPEVLGDVRRLSDSERLTYIAIALERAKDVAASLPDGATLYNAFAPLLSFVVANGYFAGCHDTSAVLYMWLCQAGCREDSMALCIGEVKGHTGRFDHSWVEVNGKVLDVAVCAPGPNGGFAGGPVFGGMDLGSNTVPRTKFGVASEDALDDEAATVYGKNLRQYQDFQVSRGYKSMAQLVQEVYGEDGKTLIAKYRDVKRDWRNPTLKPKGPN
ncbi:hypothetical protein [Caballeronia sordidicola]|uniref:hypothetical protein n=1 Tax=Caballeronia sordidicola TaxID=196367 RepID=UPI0004D02681|nr:hypothetical protein [Caballeronia sordidicola]